MLDSAGLGSAQGLGQAPVDHQGLTVLPHDDIGWLDVAVEHPAAVRVVDRVADVGEPPQQLSQLQRAAAGVRLHGRVGVEAVGGLLERVPADEPHGVVGPSVGIGPQAVDRHDPWVFQAAGDLRLEQEAGAADHIIGVPLEDLLERDLAMQLLVQCHEDSAQATPGVGAEDAESQPVGGRGADGEAGGAVGAAIGTRADIGQSVLDLGVTIGDGVEGCASGRSRGDGGEAPLGAAAVLLQVPGHQRLDGGPVVGVKMAHGDEVLGQRPALLERPGLEGPDEPGLVDQAILQGEQTEEEIAIGIGGGHDTVSRTRGGSRGRWTPKLVSASGAMNCISTIIASRRASCSSVQSDRAAVLPARPSAALLPLRIGSPSHAERAPLN